MTPADHMSGLTTQQMAAIRYPCAPLLVIAGAGSGKTTVMAQRMAHLVSAGEYTPDQVLGLTFTNKAAANLRAQVLDLLGNDADVEVSTYHSFGASLVSAHTLELDLHPRTRVLNRAQAWQLLFAVFDEFRFEVRRTFSPGSIIAPALDLADRCADHLVSIDAVEADCDVVSEAARWKSMRETAVSRRELCQVVARYHQRKRQHNLIDYGDQVALAVRLLTERPDLAVELRAQHPAVLLDEYQDTNYAQRRMLQLIYPPGSVVTAVGDDMQSIYGFRGAHLGNILQFVDHFPPAETLPLETNFRSGETSVALANRIQQEISSRNRLDKVLRAAPGTPDTTIECFLAGDEEEEAAEIARDIARRGEPWLRHAVLCRKRRLIGAIVTALENLDVPVDVIGSSGLLDRPEIVDLVAWLELLADTTDSVALLRLLLGPRYRIGMADLAALSRHAHRLGSDTSLADALSDLSTVTDVSPEARHRLAEFCEERRALAGAAARLRVVDLAETVIGRTGLWPAAGKRGRENLLRFLDLIERFSPYDGESGLPAFVEYLHMVRETEEDVPEAHGDSFAGVRVMTVHQAKGLEFDNVWVPGLARRIFPDSRSGENPITQTSALPWWVRPDDEGLPDWRVARRLADLEEPVKIRRKDEEWRLFYVACTRARRSLVLSAAHWYAGSTTPQGPSPLYEFVAAQRDLVHERFARPPTEVDPASAAKRRRLELAKSRLSQGRPTLDNVEPPTGGIVAAPPRPRLRRAPSALSVTSLTSHARCPRQFYWSTVRPLPRLTTAAARIGTDVHRWIEQRSVAEPPPGIDASDPKRGRSSEPTIAARLRDSFLATPYAGLVPEQVEAPFVLMIENRLIRGRVDAVYRRDLRTELVDFKTGREPAPDDRGAHLQLDVYALAAVDVWGHSPEELRTTYCYLRAEGDPVLVASDWNPERIAQVRSRVQRMMCAIDDEDYPTTPGDWCGSCDFSWVCAAAAEANVAGGDVGESGTARFADRAESGHS